MKILLTGNCQVDGLHVFLSRALPHFEIRRLPHLATFYGEFSQEKIADDHAWADLVFFHHKHDDPQNYPTKQPKIPLSVWYQSAPFMAQIGPQMWRDYYDTGATPEEAVYHDFDYRNRWTGCWERMMEKEEDENVPQLIRMSDFMINGKDFQLQLTCNHPTSMVFRAWANRICAFLGIRTYQEVSFEEAIAEPNLAGLPCEESATSGARSHLNLQWGGRPEDDESGLLIARQQKAEWDIHQSMPA